MLRALSVLANSSGSFLDALLSDLQREVRGAGTRLQAVISRCFDNTLALNVWDERRALGGFRETLLIES